MITFIITRGKMVEWFILSTSSVVQSSAKKIELSCKGGPNRANGKQCSNITQAGNLTQDPTLAVKNAATPQL